MTAAGMIERARVVRMRLLSPPNARKDAGINLQKVKGMRGTPRPRWSAPTVEWIACRLPLRFHGMLPAAPSTGKVISPMEIMVMAERIHGFAPGELTGNGRTDAVVRARHAATLAVKEITGMSFARIGRELGRDHTTIMHAVRRARERRQKELDFDADVTRLLSMFVPAPAASDVQVTIVSLDVT
jgi:hypothetical protein